MLNKLMGKLDSSKSTDKSSQDKTFSSFGSAQPRKAEGSNTRNSAMGNNTKLNTSGNTWNNPWKPTTARK